MLSRPHVVLFDWDNTLVDTWPIIHLALHDTFHAFDLRPWTLDEVKARVKHSMRDAFPHLFGDRWEEAGEYYRNAYRSQYADRLAPLPGAEETLRHLSQDHNLTLGVVSNKQGPQLRKEVEVLGWQPYFQVLVGASDAARDKPHPDPVLLALKELGVAPSASGVWLLGDSDIDVECANRTGIAPVFYGTYEPPSAEPHHVCGYAVDNHDAFRKLVQDVTALQKALG